MANIGYATLSIIPSFSGFSSKLSTGMAAPIAAAGGKAGTAAGANASKGFASKFQSGIGGLDTKLFAGLGIAALGKQVIGVQAQFEQSMNTLAATSDVPAAKMQQLSDFAKDMGAKTVFSAGEAADAMVELGKSGLTPAQIQAGALKSTMAVAATEGIGLADSAKIVSNAMTTFSIKGGQASTVADALAGGSKASTASVESLSQALSQVGGSAASSGLSLQETVATLSAFDAEGIKGSDAGTALKTMLSRLVPQTDKAKGAMEDLGLKFTDANGSFLPIANVAEQLQKKLGPLSDATRTEALNTIFGSDARRAAIALMHQGSAGIQKFTKATSEAGVAQKLANARMSGTAGAIEKMKGAIETAELALGETLAPTVVGVADGISSLAGVTTTLLDGFSKLPGPVRTFGLALAGLKLASFFGLNPTSWATTTGNAFSNVKTRVNQAAMAYEGARTQIRQFSGSAVTVSSGVGRLSASATALGTAFTGAGSALKSGLGKAVGAIGGPWTIAIGAGIALLSHFAQQHAEAEAEANELKETLDAQTGAVTKNTRAWAASKLADDGFMDNVRELGLDASQVTNAMLGQGEAADQLSTKLEGVVKASERRNRVDGSTYYTPRGIAAKQLLDLIGETNTSLTEQAKKARFVADATDKQGSAVKGVADATQTAEEFQAAYNTRMQDARDKVDNARNAVLDLIDAYNKQREAAVQNRRDQVGLEQAMLDAADVARKGKKTLNENTQAGIDNWNALLDLADQWNQSSDKVRTANGAWKDMRQTFINTAESMGATHKRAVALVDELLAAPKRVDIKVDDKGITRAQKHAQALKELMEELKRLGNQRLKMLDPSGGVTGPGITRGATGGKIGGYGTATSDSNLLMGSKGEWMIRARAARHYGDAFMSALNNMQLPKMAGGGPVGATGGGVNFNGPMYVQPHDYGDFMAQTQRRTRRANAGGVNF